MSSTRVFRRKGGFYPICRAVMENDNLDSFLYSVAERKAWVQCFGLPIGFWNRGTFENIASLWGKFLSPFSEDRSARCVAVFQIQTAQIFHIDEIISVVYGNYLTNVRIEEMRECFDHCIRFEGANPLGDTLASATKVYGDDILLSTPKSQLKVVLDSISAEKGKSSSRLNFDDSRINKRGVELLEEQTGLESDPFGLEPIIKRLSMSKPKSDRKVRSKENMVELQVENESKSDDLADEVMEKSRDDADCRNLDSNAADPILVDTDIVPGLSKCAGLDGNMPLVRIALLRVVVRELQSAR